MNGRPPRQLSSTTSIGSAVETMRAARGQARHFWRVFSASRVPMVVVDNDRRHLAANVAARLLFRLTLDEFLARRMDDLTPAHMHGWLRAMWARLARQGAVCGTYAGGFTDAGELRIVYCALANVLPAQHLIVFVPADWPGDELSVVEQSGAQAPRGPLSPREREVLSLIAAGAGIEEIASDLVISDTTVRTHTRNALRKLGARNRAHAIALAMRDGMIDITRTSVDELASPG